jgi:hypothetical protein
MPGILPRCWWIFEKGRTRCRKPHADTAKRQTLLWRTPSLSLILFSVKFARQMPAIAIL